MEGIKKFLTPEIITTLQNGYKGKEDANSNYIYKNNDVEYIFNGDTVAFNVDINGDGKKEIVISDEPSLRMGGRKALAEFNMENRDNVVFDVHNDVISFNLSSGKVSGENNQVKVYNYSEAQVTGKNNTVYAFNGAKATVIATEGKARASATDPSTQVIMSDYIAGNDGKTEQTHPVMLEGTAYNGSKIFQEAHNPDTILKGQALGMGYLAQRGPWAIAMARDTRSTVFQATPDGLTTKLLSAVAGKDSRVTQIGTGGEVELVKFGKVAFAQMNPKGKEILKTYDEIVDPEKTPVTKEEKASVAASLKFSDKFENFEKYKSQYK